MSSTYGYIKPLSKCSGTVWGTSYSLMYCVHLFAKGLLCTVISKMSQLKQS